MCGVDVAENLELVSAQTPGTSLCYVPSYNVHVKMLRTIPELLDDRRCGEERWLEGRF